MRALVQVSAACALVAVSAVAQRAEAHPEYGAAIPNYAIDTCDTCHPPGNSLTENSFGADCTPLVGTPFATWWAELRDGDSDNDGQTNGEELGDPCGTWATGEPPPRTTGISNPGEAASVSPTPDEPPCGPTGSAAAGTTGAATAAAGTTGGSTSQGAGGSSAVAGGAGAGTPDSSGPGLAPGPEPEGAGACAVDPGHGGGARWWVVAAALGLALRRRRRDRLLTAR